jgi:hypothetical protein
VTWFKFLAAGAVAPFSGHRWPAPHGQYPGDWDVWTGPREPCRSGLHVCRPGHLPLWLNEELYAVEVAGPLDEYDTFAVTSRARLLHRVHAWSQGTAGRFSSACAWHVRDLVADALRARGHVAEAERLEDCASIEQLAGTADRLRAAGNGVSRLAGYTADAATFATRAADEARWPMSTATTGLVAARAAQESAGAQGRDALAAERSRQAAWLAEHVGLGELPV